MHSRLIILLTVTAFLIPGCAGVKLTRKPTQQDSGPPPGSVDVSSVPDAVPRSEPKSRYGNPKTYVVLGKRYHVMESSKGFVERGIASWYGKKFHGRRTSSGETYNMYAMTAAHKNLPLPTYVQVKNLKNGRQVIVKVNDRGPFHENRIIDLSYTAAAKLDIIKSGTGLVEVRAIDPGSYRKPTAPVRKVSFRESIPGFFLQVGAFANLNNAENLLGKISALTGMVRISEAIVKGNRVYRVQVGPLKSVDLADSLVISLRKIGIWDHHIVVE